VTRVVCEDGASPSQRPSANRLDKQARAGRDPGESQVFVQSGRYFILCSHQGRSLFGQFHFATNFVEHQWSQKPRSKTFASRRRRFVSERFWIVSDCFGSFRVFFWIAVNHFCSLFVFSFLQRGHRRNVVHVFVILVVAVIDVVVVNIVTIAYRQLLLFSSTVLLAAGGALPDVAQAANSQEPANLT